MSETPNTHMTISVSPEIKRRFKALCALQGVTLGQKIAQLVENEAPDHRPPTVPSQRESNGE